MHPPVVGVPKVARKNTTLGGYMIPAGTNLIIDVQTIHHDENIWPNANKFIPERFLDTTTKRHPCALIPFSVGLRKCMY
jgi:cytochrome P450